MLTPSQVAAFAAACIVLIVVPGPSVFFIVGRTIAVGRRAALVTVLGNALGAYTLGVAVSIGISPLFDRFPVSLVILKFVGAVFLCWLGVQSIRQRKHNPVQLESDPIVRRQATLSALRQGYVVGVTNPKVLVAFAIIMPSFLNEAVEPLVLQMALLALIPVTVGLLTDSAWAICSDLARQWLSSSDSRMRALSATGGGMMIGLGLLMVAS